MTVAVNLSPFMRFDGYHMLADFLGMHSLGPRSFALATWNLRQVFFATDEPVPEQLPRNTFRFLITYAYCTWIYRLGLFLGIAVLVYHEFPKAIGIPAAAIEVLFFIAAPIVRELREMKTMGFAQLFSTRRGMMMGAVLIAGLVLAALPINHSINVPAILSPRQEAWVFPSEPAQVIAMEVRPGDTVTRGQVLARLMVPNIDQKMRLTQIKLEINQGRLLRVAADQKERAQVMVLKQEQHSLLDELDGLKQRGQALVITSPQSGVVTGATNPITTGQWVGRTDLLFHVASRDGALITGLVADRLSMRLLESARVRFVSEDGMRSAVDGVLIDVGSPGAEGQALTYLAAPNGGPVAAALSPEDHLLKPLSGQLPLRFAVVGEAPATALRGTATVEVTAQSFLGQAFGRFATVFLRESGF
jgi:putative peptide zinc metalloprotease protein